MRLRTVSGRPSFHGIPSVLPAQALIVKTIQDEITAGYRFQDQHGLFRQQVES